MEKKRIAAVIGLIGMAICIVCLVVAPFNELASTIGFTAFLVAVTISLFFYFRRGEEQAAPQEEENAEDKPE